MKKYIGKLISIEFSDRKSALHGLLVDYSDEWILLKNNVVDYVIDGYTIIKRKNIAEIIRDEDIKFTEKVLKLKNISIVNSPTVPLTNLEDILNYLTNEFGIFQFETKSETACYLGSLKSIDAKKLIINSLSPKGKRDGNEEFRPNDIRIIAFDNDYINSLKLVAKIA